jgi:integrase
VEPRTAVSRISELSGVPFTLHDLRRTFITIAESLDIPGYAFKRLLNHKDPNDMTAGYTVSNVDRLREPMQRITEFIVGNCKHRDGEKTVTG